MRLARAEVVDLEAVQLTGVVDVSVPMTLALQDVLYPLGVNCVRKLGDGVVAAWGARTLTADSPHRYVNVRRILLAVVKGLTQQLAWSVFEPNDSALWARIEGSLRAFLSALLVGGLTAGQTAAEAFFVRCDATTTPKDARDAGIAKTQAAMVAATSNKRARNHVLCSSAFALRSLMIPE